MKGALLHFRKLSKNFLRPTAARFYCSHAFVKVTCLDGTNELGGFDDIIEDGWVSGWEVFSSRGGVAWQDVSIVDPQAAGGEGEVGGVTVAAVAFM